MNAARSYQADPGAVTGNTSTRGMDGNNSSGRIYRFSSHRTGDTQLHIR